MTCENMNVEKEATSGFGWANFWSWFQTRAQQRRDRAGFSRMLNLDDNILADIGVTRGAVEAANGLPVDCDAADELRKSVRRVTPTVDLGLSQTPPSGLLGIASGSINAALRSNR